MFTRYSRAPRAVFRSAQQLANQSATYALFLRDAFNGLITTAHHTIMVVGLIAISIAIILTVKPDVVSHLKHVIPISSEFGTDVAFKLSENAAEPTASSAPLSDQTLIKKVDDHQYVVAPNLILPQAAPQHSGEENRIANALRQQQQWVTDWLSKRYRVASDATKMLVAETYRTAKEIKIDPLLVLAVMAIESGFNPFAESPLGAQGLMQIMSKIHHDKFQELGGIKAALNPAANIRVGAIILKDYVTRAGSVEAGLKIYVGAGAFDNDSGYGARVLGEYRHLKDVALGKNIPISTPSALKAPVAKPTVPEKQLVEESILPTDSKTSQAEQKV